MPDYGNGDNENLHTGGKLPRTESHMSDNIHNVTPQRAQPHQRESLESIHSRIDTEAKKRGITPTSEERGRVYKEAEKKAGY